MSIAAFDLSLVEGCVLVESVSGLPLPLSVESFADSDEGNAFLAWVDLDPRRRDELHDQALAEELLRQWRRKGEDEAA